MTRSIQKILIQLGLPADARLATMAGNELRSRIAANLPASLLEQIDGCAIHGDTLILTTPSPTWAARLHYMSRRLVDGLALPGVTQVTVRISRGAAERAIPEASPPRNLSPVAGRAIQAQAETVADPRLSHALRRLAKRAGTGTPEG